MRIMVTNDDGIDSVGLQILARAMREHGEVVVIAPDQEFSGASAAIGAINLLDPIAERRTIDGIDEAWALNLAPAMCSIVGRSGVFGEVDLVVSGINPGANIGRALYHSGTVGAALTARLGGISGVAVSQAVSGWGVSGQSWDEFVADLRWDDAAHIASEVVGALITDPPTDPVVVNINVPDVDFDEIKGWRYAEIGAVPPVDFGPFHLVPIDGAPDRQRIKMSFGQEQSLPIETDTGTIENNEVAVTMISRFSHVAAEELDTVSSALDGLLGRR